jgi:hypothetical protein
MLMLCRQSGIYAQEQNYVPGEVLAYFGDESNEVFETVGGRIACAYGNIMSYLAGEGILEAREIYHGPNGVRNLYVLKLGPAADIPRIVSDLSLFPEIKEVSPNYCGELLSEPNDFYYSVDWWVPDSDVPPGFVQL